MPPRRPRRPSKKTQVASRVHRIKSDEQWESMLRKAGEKRIVFSLFYQTTGAAAWSSNSIRSLLAKVSTQPRFSKAIFAEIDAEEYKDIASRYGARRCPVLHAIWHGETKDTWTSSLGIDTPVQLNKFLQKNIDTYVPRTGILTNIIRSMIVAGIVAGGAYVKVKLEEGKEGTGSGTTGGGEGGSDVEGNVEVLTLKKRIANAQARLRALEKSSRGKQARSQRKLLENLNAQLKILERKDQPSKKKGILERKNRKGGNEKMNDRMAEEDGHEGAIDDHNHSRRINTGALDLDIVARLRRRRFKGEVLYSDEEDILEVAEDVILS